jgi:hypothetical protein
MLRTTIGKRAQALAAALMIGTALVSLSPSEARAATRDNGARCWSYDPDTDMHNFYLPGESIWVGRNQYRCDGSYGGEWRTVPERNVRDHRGRR